MQRAKLFHIRITHETEASHDEPKSIGRASEGRGVGRADRPDTVVPAGVTTEEG